MEFQPLVVEAGLVKALCGFVPGGGAPQRLGRVGVQQQRQVRPQAAGNDFAKIRQCPFFGALGALVGPRGIFEPVKDNDHARPERGPHNRLQVLRPVGAEEQQLCLGAPSFAFGPLSQQERAQTPAQPRPAWLLGDHEGQAPLGQPFRKEAGLGGLPGALYALECDQEAAQNAPCDILSPEKNDALFFGERMSYY
jgi:hypothetical protein